MRSRDDDRRERCSKNKPKKHHGIDEAAESLGVRALIHHRKSVRRAREHDRDDREAVDLGGRARRCADRSARVHDGRSERERDDQFQARLESARSAGRHSFFCGVVGSADSPQPKKMSAALLSLPTISPQAKRSSRSLRSERSERSERTGAQSPDVLAGAGPGTVTVTIVPLVVPETDDEGGDASDTEDDVPPPPRLKRATPQEVLEMLDAAADVDPDAAQRESHDDDDDDAASVASAATTVSCHSAASAASSSSVEPLPVREHLDHQSAQLEKRMRVVVEWAEDDLADARVELAVAKAKYLLAQKRVRECERAFKKAMAKF